MENTDISEKIKTLNIEDFIWVIYVGIILLSWYSNYFEKKYFVSNDEKSKETYRKIVIFIFTILVIVYFYFLKDSYEDFMKLRNDDSNKKKNLTKLSLIGSLLVFISGIIFLYIALEDQELDVEIAFN